MTATRTVTCVCPCHRGAGRHDGAPCPHCGLLDINFDAYQPTYCAKCGSETRDGQTLCDARLCKEARS